MALKKLRWRDLRPLTRWAVLAALIDFILFLAVTFAIGGDGLSGSEQAGHYFVSNHGKLTEVGYGAWLFTRVQAVSLFVLWPVALVCAAVDSFRAVPPEEEDHSILGRKDAPPRRRGR